MHMHLIYYPNKDPIFFHWLRVQANKISSPANQKAAHVSEIQSGLLKEGGQPPSIYIYIYIYTRAKA